MEKRKSASGGGVGGETYDLEDPFLVVTTQNPIEQEGTYPLPDAQLDRFMIEYPHRLSDAGPGRMRPASELRLLASVAA